MRTTQKSGLTPSGQETPTPLPRPRLDTAEVLGCSYGQYPWDDWERWAIGQGVSVDLAALGRSTIREAYQHNWPPKLKSLCGWRDDGRRMLKLALRSPETARQRWDRLLDTDGYRGHHDEQTGAWVAYD